METRESAGLPGGIRSVVIISGFLLPAGATMLAVMGGQLPPQYLHENDVTLPFSGPGAIEVLYNDLEHNEALKAVWRLKPQSYAINTSSTPDQMAGLSGIPVSYLLCSKDNAVPWQAQTGTVEGLKAAGLHVYTEIAPTGHSPFLKMPVETARFIRRIAGETIQSGFEVGSG